MDRPENAAGTIILRCYWVHAYAGMSFKSGRLAACLLYWGGSLAARAHVCATLRVLDALAAQCPRQGHILYCATVHTSIQSWRACCGRIKALHQALGLAS